ncbi:MAG TPA: trehalose-6-phosphate synthase [Candidatus Acidoferrum sp.]|nr:trehalose-6-phosphate synthase [Candidatus Acidoferrum sp.]
MRTTLKLVLPLITSVALVSLLFAAYQVRKERRNLRNDLSRRAELLTESLQESIQPLFERNERNAEKAMQRVVDRFAQREHMKGIAVYEADGNLSVMTSTLDNSFKQVPEAAQRAVASDTGHGEFTQIAESPMYLYALPLERNGKAAGSLLVIYEAGFIDSRVLLTMRDALLSALLETLLVSGLALLLVRWTFLDPLKRTSQWLRKLRAGETDTPESALPQGELFEQIQKEVKHLARDLGAARAAAAEEAQLREKQASVWTADRLRISLQSKLKGKPLFVVANREPYMHVKGEKGIEVLVPASGLVTALEPVLEATDGTWVAHGSGSADRETVDETDHLRVPPDLPSYTLRRVWLTREEVKGYYEGFANEGLWPLCHIAHTRPTFRPDDWLQYQQANRKFADAVLQEMAGQETPIVLAQDYHFALLPRMVKDSRPDARVAIFWHIPWPNPEVFGICPWQRELVDGLLGADLIGFHTQTHCNNFLETVDRALEALTEWDRFAVNRQGHVTRVRPYPISVAFPNGKPPIEYRSAGEERARLCEELGIEGSLLGVGVDRVDYTKGILERFRGIERFIEMNPAYHRRFSFVQIGAPSRTDIPRYQQFLDEVTVEAERVNARFQSGKWKPIVFLRRHHSHQEIERFYRAASVCMVSSLHDGMNLVAKEFIAAREDEHGVLILSTFAGAALELTDALQVNPYDVQQVAAAILRALEMPDDEQAARIRRMRTTVKDHNVFRWAANLLSDLTDIRIEPPERQESAVVPGEITTGDEREEVRP